MNTEGDCFVWSLLYLSSYCMSIPPKENLTLANCCGYLAVVYTLDSRIVG